MSMSPSPLCQDSRALFPGLGALMFSYSRLWQTNHQDMSNERTQLLFFFATAVPYNTHSTGLQIYLSDCPAHTRYTSGTLKHGPQTSPTVYSIGHESLRKHAAQVPKAYSHDNFGRCATQPCSSDREFRGCWNAVDRAHTSERLCNNNGY